MAVRLTKVSLLWPAQQEASSPSEDHPVSFLHVLSTSQTSSFPTGCSLPLPSWLLPLTPCLSNPASPTPWGILTAESAVHGPPPVGWLWRTHFPVSKSGVFPRSQPPWITPDHSLLHHFPPCLCSSESPTCCPSSTVGPLVAGLCPASLLGWPSQCHSPKALSSQESQQ